jgi:MFS family permease
MARANTNSTSETAPRQAGLGSLLKNGNYRNLWLGQIISDFGDSLTMLTLLILVNALTGSAAALATMFIVLTIPQITFGLVAGVYVDRLDRKKLMIASDVLRAAVVLGFIFVRSVDDLWIMYLLGFLQASFGTLFTPARSAIIPNVVPKEQLMAANSLSQTSRIIFGLLGTGTAGVLMGLLHQYWPAFVIDAFTFVLSAFLISRIRVPAQEKSEAHEGSVSAIFGQLFEGMRVIAHKRVLSGVLVAAGVLMLGVGAVNVLLIPLIVNDLKFPVTWFGIIEFVQTAAMIVGGATAALLAARFKPTGIISAALVVVGVAIGFISIVGSMWHLVPVLVAVGLAVTPMQACFATIMQTSVADNLRGRVSSALNSVISTASLVSMGLAGVAAGADRRAQRLHRGRRDSPPGRSWLGDALPLCGQRQV